MAVKIFFIKYLLDFEVASLAGGGQRFVQSVEATLKNRRQVETMVAESVAGTWVLREQVAAYA
jgi:hypothetical protein